MQRRFPFPSFSIFSLIPRSLQKKASPRRLQLLVQLEALLRARRPRTRRRAQRPRRRQRHPRHLVPLHRDAPHARPGHQQMRRHVHAAAFTVHHQLRPAAPRHVLLLLVRRAQFQLRQPLLFRPVNHIIIAAPVRIVVLQLGHGQALPEAHLLLQGRFGDARVPARAVLVVRAPEAPQRVVGRRRVRLHLPDLLAQAAVFAPRLVELAAVGAVPGRHVGDVLGLVLVELLEHGREGVGELREERGVGVARVLGLFERFGEDGEEGINVLILA